MNVDTKGLRPIHDPKVGEMVVMTDWDGKVLHVCRVEKFETIRGRDDDDEGVQWVLGFIPEEYRDKDSPYDGTAFAFMEDVQILSMDRPKLTVRRKTPSSEADIYGWMGEVTR